MTPFSSQYYDPISTFHGSIPSIMGTRLDLIIVGAPKEQSNLVWNNIVIELERLHRMLNRFDATSELSRINSKAKNNAVSVSNEMWEILENCRQK
ncbi:MAG: FAD:protein FMN transferase [Dysgonamonadaceae bacterium]|nr:FAD:protein FMN transferase [Dysgonamonadaceae bacterium]